jgi:hypothetical protein
MDDFWGVTIVLFILLAAIVGVLVRVSNYYKEYRLVRHERKRLSKVRPTLKSGDIVLFISHTHGFTNSLFTKDLYTHSGMVVDYGRGKLSLSESTVDSCPDETGRVAALPAAAQLTPLLWRLQHYTGMVFLMALERPLTPKQEATLKQLAQTKAPYPGVLQTLKGLLLKTPAQERNCMQHTAWLLDELGLTPDALSKKGGSLQRTGAFGVSRAITRLPGAPLGNNTNRFSAIVELLIDEEVRIPDGTKARTVDVDERTKATAL